MRRDGLGRLGWHLLKSWMVWRWMVGERIDLMHLELVAATLCLEDGLKLALELLHNIGRARNVRKLV